MLAATFDGGTKCPGTLSVSSEHVPGPETFEEPATLRPIVERLFNYVRHDECHSGLPSKTVPHPASQCGLFRGTIGQSSGFVDSLGPPARRHASCVWLGHSVRGRVKLANTTQILLKSSGIETK